MRLALFKRLVGVLAAKQFPVEDDPGSLAASLDRALRSQGRSRAGRRRSYGLVEFSRFLLEVLCQLSEVFHRRPVARRFGQLAQVLRTLAQVCSIQVHPAVKR